MSSSGVEDETILELLRSADSPRLTTTEVAESLPITRSRTHTRLQQLSDDDLVERDRAGNHVVWWVPERDDELDAGDAESATGADEPGAKVAAGDGGSPEDADGGEEESAEESEGEAAAGEPEPAVGEAESETGEKTPDEPGDGEEPGESEPGTAGDDGPAEIEVEPISDEVTTRGSVTDEKRPHLETETRVGVGGPSDRPSEERGLRALALFAAVVVVFALLRNYRRGKGNE